MMMIVQLYDGKYRLFIGINCYHPTIVNLVMSFFSLEIVGIVEIVEIVEFILILVIIAIGSIGCFIIGTICLRIGLSTIIQLFQKLILQLILLLVHQFNVTMMMSSFPFRSFFRVLIIRFLWFLVYLTLMYLGFL